jgi:NAD(P) transhydrogenase
VPLIEYRASSTAAGTSYSSLTVGAPREIYPNERRVALTPQNAAVLRKKGFAKVLVEKNAGVLVYHIPRHI